MRILTEVDDGDSGGVRCYGELSDDGLDELEYQLPVVAPGRVVVTNTSRVVNHERHIHHASCSVTTTRRKTYDLGISRDRN